MGSGSGLGSSTGACIGLYRVLFALRGFAGIGARGLGLQYRVSQRPQAGSVMFALHVERFWSIRRVPAVVPKDFPKGF